MTPEQRTERTTDAAAAKKHTERIEHAAKVAWKASSYKPPWEDLTEHDKALHCAGLRAALATLEVDQP